MSIINDTLAGLTLGEPLAYRNLTAFPLQGKTGNPLIISACGRRSMMALPRCARFQKAAMSPN